MPEAIIAAVTVVLTVVAMILNSPLLTLLLLMFLAGRSEFVATSRAPMGYITEGGTYSLINTTMTETVEGARTVEALGLQPRASASDDDIAVSAQAERYTMIPAQHAVRVHRASRTTPRWCWSC